MSRDQDEVFSSSQVARRSSGATRRDCIQVGGVLGSRIALRGGLTYLNSRRFLREVGVSSGHITPIAMALTALEIVYVE
jgi:hypothetical protein